MFHYGAKFPFLMLFRNFSCIFSSVRQPSVLVQLVIVVDVSCCWGKDNCHTARNVVAGTISIKTRSQEKKDETKQHHQLNRKKKKGTTKDPESSTNKTKWLPRGRR